MFGGLRAAGLKVNTSMCSFGLKYIPYLGCIIIWYGIKHYPKKVQGIMDIGKPTTTTMVRYYRYMWPRRSHILAPLAETDINLQGVSNKNTTELKTWDMVHVDLIGTYIKSTKQQYLVGSTTNSDVSLN